MEQLHEYRMGHLGLRVTDLGRAKQFYLDTLGFQVVLETEGLILCSVGDTLLGLRGADVQTQPGDHFDPFRVGLDHLALHVPDEALENLKSQLDQAGVRNNGVELDELTNARYISFYDPDGIPWELYAMPGSSA